MCTMHTQMSSESEGELSSPTLKKRPVGRPDSSDDEDEGDQLRPRPRPFLSDDDLDTQKVDLELEDPHVYSTKNTHVWGPVRLLLDKPQVCSYAGLAILALICVDKIAYIECRG
jgi:hypothetical protein